MAPGLTHLLLFFFEREFIAQALHQLLHGGGRCATVGLLRRVQFVLQQAQLLVTLGHLLPQLLQLRLHPVDLTAVLRHQAATHNAAQLDTQPCEQLIKA